MYRVQEDDEFRIVSTASTATDVVARVVVETDFDPNSPDADRLANYEVRHTSNANRTVASTDFGRIGSTPGRVVRAVVAGVTAVKRGQCYIELLVVNHGRTMAILAADYIHSNNQIHLGNFVGPLEGRGFLSWVEAFTGDRAGNAAAIDFNLFATNARRKVYGVAWYYHCSSDVATRTLISPTLIGLGGTKPTGFTQTGLNAYFWNTSNVTLTANEEGTIASYSETSMGRTVTVDDGVATIIDTSTLPTPWPLWVTEADVDTVLRFGAITNGEAADRHSAYVLIEEWIEV